MGQTVGADDELVDESASSQAGVNPLWLRAAGGVEWGEVDIQSDGVGQDAVLLLATALVLGCVRALVKTLGSEAGDKVGRGHCNQVALVVWVLEVELLLMEA